MAIYNEDIINIELTGGNISRSFMNKTIGEGDALANRFGAYVTKNGEPANLSGVTCEGYFIRSDGGTIPITGAISGNVAYVDLPQVCYAVEGQFALAIKLTGGNAAGTIRIIDGVVSRTTTETIIDPGTILPSIEELIAEIDAAVASIPADYSSLWTSLAPAFSSSNVYSAGQDVTYNGTLYRFIVDHTGAWDASDVVAVAMGNDITDIRNALKESSGEFHDSASTVQNQAVFYNNGNIVSANGYARTDKLPIPINCTKVFFPDMYVDTTQVSYGWAIYDAQGGSSLEHYVRGGQTPYIDFTEEEAQKSYYFAVCGYSNKTTWEIVYQTSDYENQDTFGKSRTVSLTAERYVNYTNGNVLAAPNTSYKACSEYIWIPFNCKLIMFPEGTAQFNAEVGWATYSKRTGNRPNAYMRGGQTTYIIPQANERYFSFTSYNKRVTPPATTEVYFYFGNEADIAKKIMPAYNKPICFVGDSVTFGYDDDNSGAQLADPWVKQVGRELFAGVYNEGYTGATVGDSSTSGIVAWVNRYTELPDQFDIVGVMLGVNDCYRRSSAYPIGTMSDTMKTTFYGALKIFWDGMVHKYPPKNGKKLFCMIYPSVYTDNPTVWEPYYEAIKIVAKYYSIPVLDLSECSGINPHSDPDHEYWRGNETPGYYSPHLTQAGADVVAPIIADFIRNSIA